MSNELVLVDWMNFVFTNFHAAKASLYKSKGTKEIEEDDMSFIYHMELKSLFNVLKTYSNVYICKEGNNSLKWRKSVFSGYKENRKETKASDEYKLFMSSLPKLEQVLEDLPVKILRADFAEADDIIHAMVEKYHNDYDKILILSSDKDLVQLKNYYGDNIDVYNMARKKYIDKNKNIVLEKAIVGDASDGIPGIPGIGIKTFEKIIADKDEWNKKIKNGKLEMLKRFINIIDLRKFPNEYKQNILLEDENSDLNKFDADAVEMFLFENNLNQLLNNWNITKNEFMEK